MFEAYTLITTACILYIFILCTWCSCYEEDTIDTMLYIIMLYQGYAMLTWSIGSAMFTGTLDPLDVLYLLVH